MSYPNQYPQNQPPPANYQNPPANYQNPPANYQNPPPGYYQGAPQGHPVQQTYGPPPTQPQYQNNTPPPQYQSNPPPQQCYATAAPNPVAPIANAVLFIAEDHIEEKKCHHCDSHYKKLEKRKGISWCILIIIILLSCFIFLFLLLFLCLCEEYKVCPHCGHFSGHGESHGDGICLC